MSSYGRPDLLAVAAEHGELRLDSVRAVYAADIPAGSEVAGVGVPRDVA